MRRLVGNSQQVPSFFFAELMGWRGSVRLRSTIFWRLPPSLYRAKAQLQHRARWREPRTGGNRSIQDAQYVAAI
jgi:hypothetical protein